MGYCISCNAASFRMKKENLPKALKALQTEAAKPGNNWDWVNNSEILNAKTFAEAMAAFRWPVYVTTKRDGKHLDADTKVGDVTAISFDGDKLGSEEYFFQVIAPFVESGSYIEATGEDDEFWRYRFKNGRMTCDPGFRVWENWEHIVSLVLDRAEKAGQLPIYLKLHPTLDNLIADRLKKKPKRKR